MDNKEILIEILKKTFHERLTHLEKKGNEETASLQFTSKEFANLQKRIDTLVKLRKEKEQKDKLEKERKEKELQEKLAKEELLKKQKAEKAAAKKKLKSYPSMANFGRKTIAGTSLPDRESTVHDRRKTLGLEGMGHKTYRAKTPGRRKTEEEEKKEAPRHSVVPTVPTKATKKVMTRSKTSANLKETGKKTAKKVIDVHKKKKEEKEKLEKKKVKKESAEEELNKEIKEIEINPMRKTEYKALVFSDIFNDKGIFSKFLIFLSEQDKFNLFCTSKMFKSNLLETLSDTKKNLDKMSGVLIGQTIDSKLNELELKYTEEEMSKEIPPFILRKGTIKGLELLKDFNYSRIFKGGMKDDVLDKVVFLYRIYCIIIRRNDLAEIKNNRKFWDKFSEYVCKEEETKSLDALFIESANNFCFDDKAIYEIRKISMVTDKYNPLDYSNICGTSGLFAFLIKDILEYTGILIDKKKTPPIRIKKNLEFYKQKYEGVNKFVEIINKIK